MNCTNLLNFVCPIGFFAFHQSLDRASLNSDDLSRIKKEIDMKEEFLKRPVPPPTSAEMLDRRRMSTDALPPAPRNGTAVNGKKWEGRAFGNLPSLRTLAKFFD